MKNLYLYLWGAIVAMLTLNACTDEAHLPVSEENSQEESSLCTFTIPEVPVHGIDGSSRTAISIENDKLKFEWAVGDRIGILPDEGSQVYFTIDAQTAGSTQASFDGGAWALKANHQYDAYFPFIEDIMLDRTAVPVDYTNQKQTGNNSMTHLGAHDYLAAQGTTNGQGGVNYTFQRMGAVAILNFTVPNAGTELTSVTLKANEACFTTKGTINLDNEPLAITPSETAESITVGVDYTTTAANEKVTVYFMCYPDQLEGKNLNVEVNYEGSEEPLYFTTEGKNMEAGDGYVLNTQPIPYLTFSATSEQTMTMVSYRYTLDESIEYSVNGSEWTQVGKVSGDEASGITYTTITFGGEKGTLRMRGKSATGMAENENNYAKITFGNSEVPVSCTGDIRTLVDYTNYRDAATSQARFSAMFYGCTNLISAPELPATTLASYCYGFMFYGCTGLTTAPVLPATTLAEECYRSMFYRCTGLTTAPELPAETLAEECYRSMFYRCTGLTTAPELPAETLAERCYYEMFYGCTGLDTAPVLPATELESGCYQMMFQGCTGLTTAPALPATALAESCYSSMFRYCTGLTAAPVLPATELEYGCYQMMFQGCTGLTAAPVLPATDLAGSCYSSMFSGCTGLTTAPVLPATTLAEGCYSSMFQGCSNLNSVTMLATDVSAEMCLNSWLNNVATTGTFYKAAGMEESAFSRDADGIPSGWTVMDYTESE